MLLSLNSMFDQSPILEVSKRGFKEGRCVQELPR